jgi:hypothetical protein
MPPKRRRVSNGSKLRPRRTQDKSHALPLSIPVRGNSEKGDVMNRTWIMRSVAVVAMVFGAALLFAPNALLALYKAEQLNGPGVYNSMLYGACLVALAVMNWSASTAPEMEARHVVLGTFVAHAIALLVALFRQLTDPAVPPAAWMNVLLFLIFAVLFGYLQFAHAGSRPAAGSAA